MRNSDGIKGDEMWVKVEVLQLGLCSFGDEEGDSVASLC